MPPGRKLVLADTVLIAITVVVSGGFVLGHVPQLAGHSYFATAENRWEQLLHPHIPDWMAVKDAQATTWFYEGLPPGRAIPWGVWVTPLLRWYALMLVVWLVMICLVVMLRRPWVEGERLIFPLTVLPLELAAETRAAVLATRTPAYARQGENCFYLSPQMPHLHDTDAPFTVKSGRLIYAAAPLFREYWQGDRRVQIIVPYFPLRDEQVAQIEEWPRLAAVEIAMRGEYQEGLPVQGAMVTLVEEGVFDALRSAGGTPHVRFDEWLMDRYHIGRTNEQGQFLFPMVKEGEYVLVGSAPGHPRSRRPQAIVHGEGRAVILPPLTLTPPAEEDDAGPGGAGGGQHTARPDFVLEMIPPVLTWDEAEPDGVARGLLRVWCLSDYAGQLRLGSEGVPEGVALAFGSNPAWVAGVTDVPVTLRVRHARGGVARIRLVATDGVRTNSTTLVVAMAAGQLRMDPEHPTLRPGGRAQVRVHWDAIDGEGQAAMFSVERLPRSVWVKVDTIRAHSHVEPLRLEGLTPEKALAAGTALSAGLPVAVEGPVRLPTVTRAHIERAPAEAPLLGVLLGPGGWVDLTVAVGADITGDRVSLPVRCEIGAKVIKQTLEFTLVR